jgi:hypothetical protein
MPTFNITDPTSGKSMRITGDSPPTEAELTQIFSSMGATEQNVIPRTPQTAQAQMLDYMKQNKVGQLAIENAPMALAPNPKDIINTGINKVASYLGGAAEKTYASAAKMPLSEKWSQLRGRIGGPVSDRLLATRAGIENRIPISERGLQMAKEAESKAKKLVDNAVELLTSQGKGVETKTLTQNLDHLYEQALSSGNTPKAITAIDKTVKNFIKGKDRILTPSEVNALKRQLYKESSNFGKQFKDFESATTKAIANEAKNALEKMNPQLAKLNQDDAAYIKLKDALEKAISRESNKYAIGLTEGVGAGVGGAYGAIKGGDATSTGEGIASGILLTKIMRDPMVLSQLAFALNKASKANLQGVGQAMAKGTAMALQPKEAEAATLADYAKGGDNPRARAIREAAGEQPAPQAASTPAPTPQPVPAPAPTMNQGQLSQYDAETARIKADFEKRKKAEEEMLNPKPKQQSMRLDKETALALLEEAGGDKAKARKLAKERGYIL